MKAEVLLKRLLFEKSDAETTKDLMRYLWDRMEKEADGTFGEWVSAAEREPYEDGLYITCDADGAVSVNTYLLDPDKQGFEPQCHWIDPMCCNCARESITHWMDFPEAPNQNGGAE